MEKLNPKIDGTSKDIVKENIEKLKQIFPDVFCEDTVDFDKLKEVMGSYVEDKEERYSFTWYGKSQARRIAQTPSTGTLRPCKEESKNWDTTQNIFIEGDNLEVLKLLQKSYHKKVKMIYIDPPYNTGKEFIYPDNYKDNLDTYMRYTGQKDSEGYKFSTNTETTGRYHTNWLNMMYPRLKLARNLLKDDGVIFISIDDNEVANLKKICDEIFGEENFVSSIVWEKRFTRSNNAKLFATLTENILLYRKSDILDTIREPRNEKADSIYSNPDNDPRGIWTSVSYVNPATKEQRPNLVYKIENPYTGEMVEHPTNAWKYEKKTFQTHLNENRLFWGINGENKFPRLKRFLSEMEGGMVPVDLWSREQSGTTDEGSKELEKLFKAKIFDFPKPSKLIKKALRVAINIPSAIVLDFFSGSSPSAQAVLDLNLEENANHKFIMVQLPEPTEENSEAFKAGYKTIADIGKERIRRAGENILKENKNKQGIENLDVGFKVFKLDSSNIKSWDADFDNLEQSLFDAVYNIKDERTEDDVLYEILLKYGLDLTLPIEERKIADKTVYSIGMGALVICLGSEITIDVVEGIGKLKEELNPEVMRVVFKDSGFKDDVIKTNTIQILKQFNIEDVKSL